MTKTTALHDRHAALGATFTDFGGWSMPVRYTSDLAEHHAVRASAGLFDISHMAEFDVTGPDAAALLDHALAGHLSPMRVGKAKYSLVLADDGTVVDDVIVYRTGDEAFFVISNAGNRDAVAAAFAERSAGFAARVDDVSDDTALLAVQGPRSREVVEALGLVESLDGLGYYASLPGRFDGAPVLIARTGYTGEDGYELAIAADRAGALWDAMVIAGEPFDLVPAGLASRDTLRLEAGMPLYGHELSRAVKPVQAGLGRVVASLKGSFVGQGRTDAEPGAPVLVGLVSAGRRAGRAGYAVLSGDGTAVGEVTSGALSPTLGHPIALAYVQPALAEPGTELFIDVRGTRVAATVTPPPFYRRNA